MGWQVQILHAKPNPIGKDRDQYGPKPQQLLGEWVELKNTGDVPVRFSSIHLYHTEYSAGCIPHKDLGVYWNDKSSDLLEPGQIVRVHTGKKADAYLMNPVDKIGCDWRSFAEKGSFVLNNVCGDKIFVFGKNEKGEWVQVDSASYQSNPPEGAILVRSGDYLVPSSASGYR